MSGAPPFFFKPDPAGFDDRIGEDDQPRWDADDEARPWSSTSVWCIARGICGHDVRRSRRRDLARQRVAPIGIAAVGVVPTFGYPLVRPGVEKPLALDLHGQFEGTTEGAGDIARRILNRMSQESLDRPVLLAGYACIRTPLPIMPSR